MAEQTEAPRIKTFKDKKEKRKAVEDDIANPSPRKKSKVSSQENGHANGTSKKSTGGPEPMVIDAEVSQKHQNGAKDDASANLSKKSKKSKDKSSSQETANGISKTSSKDTSPTSIDAADDKKQQNGATEDGTETPKKKSKKSKDKSSTQELTNGTSRNPSEDKSPLPIKAADAEQHQKGTKEDVSVSFKKKSKKSKDKSAGAEAVNDAQNISTSQATTNGTRSQNDDSAGEKKKPKKTKEVSAASQDDSESAKHQRPTPLATQDIDDTASPTKDKKSKKAKESSSQLQSSSETLELEKPTSSTSTQDLDATALPIKKKKSKKTKESSSQLESNSEPPKLQKTASLASQESTALASPVKSQPNSKTNSKLSEPASPTATTTTSANIDLSKPYHTLPLHSILGLKSSRPSAPQSPFHNQHTHLYLPLSPITLSSPLTGLCAEHLSPLLLKYHPPLHGVILSWAAPRFSAECLDSKGRPLAVSVAEYAAPMIWVDVDFLLFKPMRGDKVEGKVVMQTEGYIGLQVFNLFSARIPKTHLPEEWVWTGNTSSSQKRKPQKGQLKGSEAVAAKEAVKVVDDSDSGFWITSEGKKLEGIIEFWVWDVDISYSGRDLDWGLPSIEGCIVDVKVMVERENARRARDDGRKV